MFFFQNELQLLETVLFALRIMHTHSATRRPDLSTVVGIGPSLVGQPCLYQIYYAHSHPCSNFSDFNRGELSQLATDIMANLIFFFFSID